jgi:hypothetical protein
MAACNFFIVLHPNYNFRYIWLDLMTRLISSASQNLHTCIYPILTVTMDPDVNKPQNDCEHAFTFRHVPHHNYPTKRHVLPSYKVESFN